MLILDVRGNQLGYLKFKSSSVKADVCAKYGVYPSMTRWST